MKNTPAVTSSFGEKRSLHVHAGIDLSCGGRIGLPVLAAANGTVTRISYSPWGYGKAIYIKLDDGYTMVYAHLSRLIGPLEKMVFREQVRNGRYRLNFFPGKSHAAGSKRLRVARGQVIAYSGETGVGYPHLHFEIRDKKNYPINPLNAGFPVKDPHAPTIADILVRPLSEAGLVNGRSEAFVWQVKKGKGSRYAFRDTVWISGSAGLAISSNDVITHAKYSAAVYRRKFFVNDSLVFAASYDTLPYEVSHHVLQDRDLPALQSGIGSYEKLYVPAGSKLPVYSPFTTGDGILRQADYMPGLHSVGIELSDAYGNKTRVWGTVGIGAPPQVKALSFVEGDGKTGIRLSMEKGDFPITRPVLELSSDGKDWEFFSALEREWKPGKENNFWIGKPQGEMLYARAYAVDSMNQKGPALYAVWARKIRDEFAGDLTRSWRGERLHLTIPVTATSVASPKARLLMRNLPAVEVPIQRTAMDLWEGSVSLAGMELDSGYLEARYVEEGVSIIQSVCPFRVTPKRGGIIKSADGSASLDVPADAVSRTLIAELVPRQIRSERATPEMKAVCPTYTLLPEVFFLDNKYEGEISVSFPGKNGKRAGVFAWNGKEWSFQGGPSPNDVRIFSFRSLATRPFVVLADTVAPRVHHVSIKDKQVLKSPPKRIRFRIDEEGSGIESDTQIRTEIDGDIWVNEFDPEKMEVRILGVRGIKPGPHKLVIRVTDAVDNQTEKTIRFKIWGPFRGPGSISKKKK